MTASRILGIKRMVVGNRRLAVTTPFGVWIAAARTSSQTSRALSGDVQF